MRDEVGTAVSTLAHQPWEFNVLLVLMLFVAYYLKSFNILNYAIFVVPITAMVVMLVSTVDPQDASSLVLARCYDTTIGALIAIIASFLFSGFA